MTVNKTVSLVLGSGAARGLTHIGVIDWLEEHGYRIASVAGASMGALVGGIYAAGKLDSYRNWVVALERSDVLRVLDLAFSSEGLIKGNRLIETLKLMVGEHTIEELPITYTAVATDLERQREVWLTEGPLFDAIRASIAIPTIFTPHTCKGMKLLDGGMLNPVPIAPTFKDMTDLTVAVNLNASRSKADTLSARRARHKETEETMGYKKYIKEFLEHFQDGETTQHKRELGLLELLGSSFETMQAAISSAKLASYPPDVLINIPRDACKAYEFDRAAELIELGYQMTAKAMPANGS
jgi:NTE family protein